MAHDLVDAFVNIAPASTYTRPPTCDMLAFLAFACVGAQKLDACVLSIHKREIQRLMHENVHDSSPLMLFLYGIYDYAGLQIMGLQPDSRSALSTPLFFHPPAMTGPFMPACLPRLFGPPPASSAFGTTSFGLLKGSFWPCSTEACPPPCIAPGSRAGHHRRREPFLQHASGFFGQSPAIPHVQALKAREGEENFHAQVG